MQHLNEFKLPEGFRGRSAAFVQLWWIVEACLFKTSPHLFDGWRRFLLRLFGARIGKKVKIRPSVTITYPWKVQIGDYSWIGDHVTLYSLSEINIGANVVISQKSYLCGGSHDYKLSDFPIYGQTITIEDECWIATDVYVAPGITIGAGAVVGARSSVFKNLPAKMVCIGSPAKPVHQRG